MNRFDFSEFRVVVVTGPQRSGTTIAARIIAKESRMRYVDENEYGTRDLSAWLSLVHNGAGIVIQSPAMSRHLISISHYDGVAVVWMLRPLSGIIDSERRIHWRDGDEKAKYSNYMGVLPISLVKLIYWRVHQSPAMSYGVEMAYSDFSEHPLWVPTDKRRQFTSRQWALEASRE